MNKAENYTDQELLERVGMDSPTGFNLMDDKTNVKDFIREYCITDGPTSVPSFKIYYDYCKRWNPHGNKLSKIQFFRVFNKVHKVKRTNTIRYYNLNQGEFNLEKDSLDEAKRFDERYRKRIKEKNKQKIESKISGIAEKI